MDEAAAEPVALPGSGGVVRFFGVRLPALVAGVYCVEGRVGEGALGCGDLGEGEGDVAHELGRCVLERAFDGVGVVMATAKEGVVGDRGVIDVREGAGMGRSSPVSSSPRWLCS